MSPLPRLILIPGWAHTASELEDLRKYLENSTDVSAVSTGDLWSTEAEVPSPSSYAQNLAKMIGKIGGQVFIAGWSLGGIIALETALNWPKLFKGLILISSTPKFCLGSGWATGTPTGAIRSMLAGLKRNPHSVFKAFFENIIRLSKDTEAMLKARIESAGSMNPRELKYGLEYLRDADFCNEVKSLCLPTLIVHGRQDAIINVEAAYNLNRLLAHSTLHVYDDYGHGLPCQNPQPVADDIMRFIEECGKTKER